MRTLGAPPNNAVLSPGSSDMEFLLLCIREVGRERLRWPTGEWGAVKRRLSSRPRSSSMLGIVVVVVGSRQLREFVRVSRPVKVPRYYVSCRHAYVAPSLYHRLRLKFIAL